MTKRLAMTVVGLFVVAGTALAWPAAPTPPDEGDAPAPPTTTVAPIQNGTVAVTITGGHDIGTNDDGRPVALIAAALNVTPAHGTGGRRDQPRAKCLPRVSTCPW
jgi:hypothetical protein